MQTISIPFNQDISNATEPKIIFTSPVSKISGVWDAVIKGNNVEFTSNLEPGVWEVEAVVSLPNFNLSSGVINYIL